MNERSLLTSDLKLAELKTNELNRSSNGLLTCKGVVSGILDPYQIEQMQDLGKLNEHFRENAIEWCGRSSLGITGRPFNPELIDLEGNRVTISGNFVSYLGFKEAFEALNIGNDIGRLLVNTKRFQINNPTTLDILMRQEYGQAIRVPNGSRIIKFSEIQDNEGNLLFPQDNSYGIEIPLINASAIWDSELLGNIQYLEQVISHGRNSITRLINWRNILENNIFINSISFFLGGIELNLNGVSAIIQQSLNQKGLFHINARFIDGGRSGGNLNEIRNENGEIIFRNIKFVELFNLSNDKIKLINGKIYLKIGNPYPDLSKMPLQVRKIDTSGYRGLHGSLSVGLVNDVMKKLGKNIDEGNDFCIIIQNGNIYSVTWRDSLKFQCNSIEYLDKEKRELKYCDIDGLSELANHLKARFGGEWESKIAFFRFIPPIEVIESLKQIGIRQIVIDDMQMSLDAFNSSCERVSYLNNHDAISNSNLQNILNNTRTGAIRLYRVRSGILEEFKYMLWGAQSSFERLEKSRFGICIYGGSGSNPDKAKKRFLGLFKKLNELYPNQFFIVQGRGPGVMQGANEAAIETGILSIGIGSNLSSEQKTTQKPHLELVLEGANRSDRQSIMTKMPSIFIADLEDRASTGTEGEINDEITALSLRERPITPVFIIGDPDTNILSGLVKKKIEYIMKNGLHKGNTDLDKLFIFCKNEQELEGRLIEFLNSPNRWYEKYGIDPKFVAEGRKKGGKGKDIGWPVGELFDY